MKGKVSLTRAEIANFQVKMGDIFFTRTSETIDEIGFPSVMLDEPKDTVFSGFVLRGRVLQDDPLTLQFKRYVFFTDAFRKEMVKKSSITTRALTSGTAIKNMEFVFPKNKKEQEFIGTFFRQLDRLITLHQCNCNMATRPCEWSSGLRAIAWEQRKLGEIGNAYSGVGFPDNEQGGTEGIPFFKVSDMNSIGNENELQKANNYVDIFQISRHKWKPITEVPAIFFAKVGAAVMLNRKRLVQYPFLLDNNTMAYSFEKEVWNISFGKSLFETIDLTSLVQVGALPSYNASDVEDIKIFLPSLQEQARIGTFFRHLDRLITLHQRKHILLT